MSTNKRPLVGRVGFPDDLDDFQRGILAQVKESFAERIWLPKYDDNSLLRFCRAREFNFDQICVMLSAHFEWETKNVEIDLWNKPFEDLRECLELYPHGYHGVSIEGDPVYIQRIGKADLSRLLKLHPIEYLLDSTAQDYERTLALRLPCCSIASGRTVDQIVVILDLKGMGMFSFSATVREVMKKMSDVGSNHYPEMLKKMIIVNTPTTFSVIYQFIKLLLNERTLSKLLVLNSMKDAKEVAKLHEFVAPGQLPTFLGGTWDYASETAWLDNKLGPWNSDLIADEVRKSNTWALGTQLLKPSAV